MSSSLNPSPTPAAAAATNSRSVTPIPPVSLTPQIRDFCEHQGEALAQQFFHALLASNFDSNQSGTLRDLQEPFYESFKRSLDRLALQNEVQFDSQRGWERLAELQREQTPDNMYVKY